MIITIKRATLDYPTKHISCSLDSTIQWDRTLFFKSHVEWRRPIIKGGQDHLTCSFHNRSHMDRPKICIHHYGTVWLKLYHPNCQYQRSTIDGHCPCTIDPLLEIQITQSMDFILMLICCTLVLKVCDSPNKDILVQWNNISTVQTLQLWALL